MAASRYSIFNEDSSAVPLKAAFNVILFSS
jgi:hypothetical protein